MDQIKDKHRVDYFVYLFLSTATPNLMMFDALTPLDSQVIAILLVNLVSIIVKCGKIKKIYIYSYSYLLHEVLNEGR